MPEGLDLQIVQDMITTQEARLQSLGETIDSFCLIHDRFQEDIFQTKEEREKVKTELREILAQGEHLRRKDFDHTMQGVKTAQEERERDVKTLLKTYIQGQQAMAQRLRDTLKSFRECLTQGEVQRIRECRALIQEIISQQEERKCEVASKLQEFHNEQLALTQRLKDLLAKGRELRIKDLKEMLNEFNAQRQKRWAFQRQRKTAVATFLNQGG